MTSETAPTLGDKAHGDEKTFLGHPLGLSFIVFTEAFERFSFYGMQALLVLYMTSHLFSAGSIEAVWFLQSYRGFIESIYGEVTTIALATQIFGLYIGLVYFTPVIGGLIGDRWIGQTKAVLLGAIMMALGHFLMAFEFAFLMALASLIIGSGLLKGNLAAQVGALYQLNDQRRDSAYSIYSIAINVGAATAPIVCGTLGEVYGWHYGFGVAGVGMLVSIAIYLMGLSSLPADISVGERAANAAPTTSTSSFGKSFFALAAIFVIASLFWVAQTQVWNAYPLWLKGRVDREILGFEVLVTWFQSIDATAVLVLAPPVLWLWHKQRKAGREPSDMMKLFIGSLVFFGAMAWLSAGEVVAGSGQVSVFWPLVFHFICALGFLYVWPVVLSLVSKTAPPEVNSMMVGGSYLTLFVGSNVAGYLGGFYEVMTPAAFWFMHGVVVGVGAVLALLLRGPINKALQAE